MKNAEKKSAGSERAEVIGMFLEKLNAERGGVFKPLTAARVGMMLRFIKSAKDLRAFYSECLNATSFSKYYWWQFKRVREVNQDKQSIVQDRFK